MIRGLASLAQPLLSALDPERAHGLAIQALKAGLHPRAAGPDDLRLAVRLWDLTFPNPVGMAAGFDKNGEVPDALIAGGLGFVEVGSVTPRPQGGNPRPRIFRLPAERAVINRLGFNNEGHAAMLGRLRNRRGQGLVGVNVGANKDAADRTSDYVAGIETFAAHAAYLTVNVSSPNTPGLRDLQHAEALDDLLSRAVAARDAQAPATGRKVPLLLKIAPDLDEPALDGIALGLTRHGLDGLIVSNTTIRRDGVSGPNAGQEGGLSGRPLFSRSTAILARMRKRLPPEVALVGVGGVDSGAAAYEKIRAGASLVQLYTGLVYEGFGLVETIKRDLLRCLRRDGHSDLSQAVGTATDHWAGEPL